MQVTQRAKKHLEARLRRQRMDLKEYWALKEQNRALWLQITLGETHFLPLLFPAGVTYDTGVLDYTAETGYFIRSGLDNKVD